MKAIIAGSRQITDYNFFVNLLVNMLNKNNISISEIISGTAAGADQMGEEFAKDYNISLKKFPADWNNLNVVPCVVGVNKGGVKYNKVAGHNRNQLMADYGDLLIAFHFDNSAGTKDMINRMIKLNKKVIIFQIDKSWNTIINYDHYSNDLFYK